MSALPPNDVCERARLSRDPRFDGRFFVGVLTTGIFCRPICPVRIPATENVRFYASAASALAAGYRPCLRCRPERSPLHKDWSMGHPLVSAALDAIYRGELDHVTEGEFAQGFGISARQLHRTFRQVLAVTPGEIARMRRLTVAKRLIDETTLGFTAIACLSGYRSLRRFNEAIQEVYGRAPTDLRRTAPKGDKLPSAANITINLPLHAPYNHDWILSFLATRALPGVDEVSGHSYLRHCAGSAVRVDLLPQRASVTLPAAALNDVLPRVRRLLDIDAQSSVIDAHLQQHEELRAVIAAHPGLRVPGAWDPFELAVRAILGQQVSVSGATTLAMRLVARYGAGQFPTPAALALENPAGIGMPGKRGAAIQALAQAVQAGDISFVNLDSEQLRAQLQSIAGIGPWTAEYIAMRALSDPDAFPIHDIVLRKAVQPGKTLAPTELLRRAEAYRPWRSYAVMYLWKRASILRNQPKH